MAADDDDDRILDKVNTSWNFCKFSSTFASDDELKLGRTQRVQADVDQVHSGLFQPREQPGQVDAVGCHGDCFEALQRPQVCCRARRRRGKVREIFKNKWISFMDSLQGGGFLIVNASCGFNLNGEPRGVVLS